MPQDRSAIRKMLQDKAAADRSINSFPPAFLAAASPYMSQNNFSPRVRVACSSGCRPLMVGLRIAKVIFLGDVAVGKTCLVNRFCSRMFDANYKATIGVDFEVERFDILQVPYNLQIWDTAGQERFRCIAASYYRSAHAIVLVFDATNISSLSHCRRWLEEALSVCRNTRPHVFLVATKMDLMSDHEYIGMEIAAARVAKDLGAEYWAVSARSGENVTPFFFRLAALTFDTAVLRELDARPTNGVAIGSDLVGGPNPGNRRSTVRAGSQSPARDCSPGCPEI